jgi:hypothetical protein
MKFSS